MPRPLVQGISKKPTIEAAHISGTPNGMRGSQRAKNRNRNHLLSKSIRGALSGSKPYSVASKDAPHPAVCTKRLTPSNTKGVNSLESRKPNTALISRSEEHTSELQSRPHLVC